MPRVIVKSLILFLGLLPMSIAQDSRSQTEVYHVLPGDVLQISVWKEPDLQLEVLVRPDSAFSFPLTGDISTKGQSVVDLQQEIAQRLGRYITDPVVTVSVKEVLGNKIYVIGQVNNPGEFIVNPQVDIMQALSRAGGTTPFADLNSIKVLRREGERQVAIPFKYNDVAKGRNLEQNRVLQSGDVVVVP